VILDFAEERDIDLIVMGTHGRRGLGYLFLGSVAEKIVRRAKCPVLTVRESRHPRPVDRRTRILAPVDFSESSLQALSHAKEITAFYGSRLSLFHVIEETVHPYFYGTGKTSILEFRPDIKSRCEKAMKRMFAEAPGPDVEVTHHTETGHAVREILRFVEREKVDLLVISTHGLTGLRHFLIGSIAEKVVRRAPCPVLTVKAFGKSLVRQE
jgi:nucleotide-binding universal stress UspA family protein